MFLPRILLLLLWHQPVPTYNTVNFSTNQKIIFIVQSGMCACTVNQDLYFYNRHRLLGLPWDQAGVVPISGLSQYPIVLSWSFAEVRKSRPGNGVIIKRVVPLPRCQYMDKLFVTRTWPSVYTDLLTSSLKYLQFTNSVWFTKYIRFTRNFRRQCVRELPETYKWFIEKLLYRGIEVNPQSIICYFVFVLQSTSPYNTSSLFRKRRWFRRFI